MRKTVKLSPQQEAQQRHEIMQSVPVQIECDQTEIQGAKHCEMRILREFLISNITDTRGAKLSQGALGRTAISGCEYGSKSKQREQRALKIGNF